MHKKENRLPESLQALALQNIKKGNTAESQKRHYLLTGVISNALHEISTQLVWVAFCIKQLKKGDAERICKALNIDPDLMESLHVYMHKMDNLPKDYREAALKEIQSNLIKPIVRQFVKL